VAIFHPFNSGFAFRAAWRSFHLSAAAEIGSYEQKYLRKNYNPES